MIDLQKAALIVKKSEIVVGLEKYKYIMRTASKVDVSRDEEFQENGLCDVKKIDFILWQDR